MDFEINWIDVSKNIETREQPVVLHRRPVSSTRAQSGIGHITFQGDFWVPVSNLLTPEVKWAVTSSGEFVRVPVFAYSTASKSRGAVLATGIELGIRAADSLRNKVRVSPPRVLLFAHGEVHPAGDAYQCYMGMAFRADR